MQLPHVDDLPIFREIVEQTDRGAAIIAVGYVETKLLAAIKACLRKDNSVAHKLLKGSGLLASLSNKIDLGYLLGLYRNETRKDFHLIREIRNKFAHNPTPHDFGSEYIRTRCDRLTIIDRVHPKEFTDLHRIRPLNKDSARQEFLESLSVIWTSLDYDSKYYEFYDRAGQVHPL